MQPTHTVHVVYISIPADNYRNKNSWAIFCTGYQYIFLVALRTTPTDL